MWPQVLASAGLALAWAQLVRSAWLIVVGCVVIAFTVSAVRWYVWKARHPVISRDEYAADWREAMRRAARWN